MLVTPRNYDKKISRLLKEHPGGQLFLSLPGAGPNLAARLLAEIGDNRDRYATAYSLPCETGTAHASQRAKGKRNPEALRVVAHKWLKIIFAMRSQVPSTTSGPICLPTSALRFRPHDLYDLYAQPHHPIDIRSPRPSCSV
ncbi:MAG: transposase [Bacillota bacterium]